jgi:F-type H+-transporting ATPase subunit delta
MAELATVARPYAEALFKAVPAAEAAAAAEQLRALATISAQPQLRQFADDPKATAAQVFDVIASVARMTLSERVKNLLATMIDNGRLAALPAVADQFQALVSERTGVSEAKVFSAYALDATQLADVVAVLERRFGRKLVAEVIVDPTLIGGVRVEVGDEVLDTTVKARLEQMKAALTS